MPSFNNIGGPFMRSLNHPGIEQGADEGGAALPRQGGGVARPKFPFRSPPLSQAKFTITGVTRDSAGNPLANCLVELYLQLLLPTGQPMAPPTELEVMETLSDGSGNFQFTVPGNSDVYQITAYLIGTPDRASITLNNLRGAVGG